MTGESLEKKGLADRWPFDSLLATKLEIPLLGSRIVRRSRLTALLQAGLDRRVTTIIAPAGYGKTTLLGEWLSSFAMADWRILWLSLDAFDNAPLRLWAYVAAALRKVYPNLRFDPQYAIRQGHDPHDLLLLNPLFNEIAQVPHQLCLILDDYHVIHEEHVHRSVRYLVEHQPQNLHLILSSRVTPPIPLARLRAQRQLVEVTAKDLSFTPEETRTFLADVMQFDTGPEMVAALLKATEGWAAGLQLAALSWQGRIGASLLQEGDALAGNQQIFAYLTEEVLNQQNEEIQDFLLKTSILAELTAPLCDALLERNDSQDLLQQIERANLFIVCLDSHQRWYRYHPLFADALRIHLERTHPGLACKLHRAAYAWLLENGHLDKAVTHALAAGDTERAAEIADACALQAIIAWDLTSLVQWISHFSEDMLRKRPRLGVYCALAHFYLGQGDRVEPRLQMVERMLEESQEASSPAEIDQVRWELAAVRAVADLMRSLYPQSITRILRLMENAPRDDAYFYGFLNHGLAKAYEVANNLQAAVEAFEAGCQFAIAHNLPYGYVHSRCELARILKKQGRLREAEQEYQRTLDVALQSRLDAGIVGLAQTGLLETALERNDLEAAGHWAKEIVDHYDQIEACTSVWAFLGLVASRLSRYYLALRDIDNARLYLHNAMRSMHNVGASFAGLPNELIDIQVRLWLAQPEQKPEDRWLRDKLAILADTEKPTMAEQAAMARIHLVRHEPGRALAILSELEAIAREVRCGERLLEALLLQALACEAEGNSLRAMQRLEEALEIAAAEGYARIFIDEGEPMRALLIACLAREQGQGTDLQKPHHNYLQDLLAAFVPCAEAQPRRPAPQEAQTIIISPALEPLSRRELEVLELLAAGKSTKEVAATLVISVNTAKAHVKSIYRKLNTHTRKGALRRTRELGIALMAD